MKIKFFFAAIAATFVFSCAPKVTVTAAEPSVVVPPKIEAAETPNPDGTASTKTIVEGKDLYGNNCAKCHKLYDPKDYSLNEWSPILTRMQRKARLDDTQMAMIHDYIASETK